MRTEKLNRPLFLLLYLLPVLLFLILRDLPFLTGERIYFHDSLLAMISQHLMFEKLFGGHIPLWSPELNAGQPLWPNAELVASFDPVALLAWGGGWVFHVDSLLCYQWTCFFWFLFFCGGATYFARRWTGNPYLLGAVFVTLYGGGMADMLPCQSYGFLIAFRYAPFLLEAMVRFGMQPGSRSAIGLGAAAGLAAGGYQTPYLLILSLVFFTSAVMGFRPSGRELLRWGAVAALLASLGAAPAIVAVWKMTQLTPVARIFEPTHWSLAPLRFFGGLVPFSGLGYGHGNSYLGVLPALLMIGGVGLSLLRFRTLRVVERANLFVFVAALFLTLGGAGLWPTSWGLFGGLRNWGFCLSLVMLGGVLIMVSAAERWSRHFRYAQRFGFILWAVTLTDLLLVTAFRPPSGPLRTASLEAVVPHLQPARWAEWSPRRPFEYFYPMHYPFHFEGPAVRHQAAARIHPFVNRLPAGMPEMTGPLTHHFRLPRYHRLLTQFGEDGFLKSHLGVSSDILGFDSRYLMVRGPEEAVLALRQDPRRRVVEGEGPSSEVMPPLAFLKPERFVGGALRVKIHALNPGLLYYRDNFDPDWQATVNGKPVPVLPVDLTAKGILLPPGRSDVEFTYYPRAYLFAFGARLGFYLGLLVFFWFFIVSRKKPLRSVFRNETSAESAI